MRHLSNVPLLLLVLIAYLGVVLLSGEGSAVLQRPVFSLTLFSGAEFRLDGNGIFLILGLFLLFFEVLKSTRVGASTVIDHLLSTFVFVGFLVAFIVVPAAGTQEFLALTLMSLIDVLSGFTVGIATARRDFGVDPSLHGG